MPAHHPTAAVPAVLWGLLAARVQAPAAPPPPPSQTVSASVAQAAVAAACPLGPAGYLRARLRGASSLDVDWRGADLQCDGGVRPDERGMRLTFASRKDTAGHQLRFVFGIDATPKTRAARAVPVNLTVIFEGEHRLYATRSDRCTLDELHSVAAVVDGKRLLRVRARGFCINEAQALDGGAGLLISRFDFLGAIPVENHAP